MVATHILALGWPPGRVTKSEPGLFGHSSKIMAAMYWYRYFLSLWWLPDIFQCYCSRQVFSRAIVAAMYFLALWGPPGTVLAIVMVTARYFLSLWWPPGTGTVPSIAIVAAGYLQPYGGRHVGTLQRYNGRQLPVPSSAMVTLLPQMFLLNSVHLISINKKIKKSRPFY